MQLYLQEVSASVSSSVSNQVLMRSPLEPDTEAVSLNSMSQHSLEEMYKLLQGLSLLVQALPLL